MNFNEGVGYSRLMRSLDSKCPYPTTLYVSFANDYTDVQLGVLHFNRGDQRAYFEPLDPNRVSLLVEQRRYRPSESEFFLIARDLLENPYSGTSASIDVSVGAMASNGIYPTLALDIVEVDSYLLQ